MANKMVNDGSVLLDNFDFAFNYVKHLFAIPGEIKDYQRSCIHSILLGKDCFVAQPTGSGKSLIFQCLPVVFDLIYPHQTTPGRIMEKAVLVISPLISLMEDQVCFLTSIGLKAVCLSKNAQAAKLEEVSQREPD